MFFFWVDLWGGATLILGLPEKGLGGFDAAAFSIAFPLLWYLNHFSEL